MVGISWYNFLNPNFVIFFSIFKIILPPKIMIRIPIRFLVQSYKTISVSQSEITISVMIILIAMLLGIAIRVKLSNK